ncbi:PD-(D/E)XK nuclease family protein [Nonomuraea mesophila]|uniref:PD-(D/E)XK nuclease family protein n=1 Tax=Nonomuraea mesophila TaxID=2530382 RepID=A0A4V2Z654_9ACTN|nr:PD-(D/E)XK nuclease family protein [Nonomuraea mesophila]TDE30157.1 PD-(D/E)XK nuclease family protein [Nonomuraea mesophila]
MNTQLPLEGMPRRLYSCTPSRLNAWLDCRRRYRFTYLDRPQPSKGPAWAHNSVGASVHNALAGWWREPYERRTPLTAAVLLTNGWITEGFRDAEQSGRWLGRARDLVSGYVATLDPSDDPVGVERTVATRTKVVALSGRIDRLDRRGDELVVVDYKTGRRPLTQDDARSSLALAAYAIAASTMMRTPCRTVELHHLPTGEIVQWRHTEESLTRHLRRAEEIASEAAEADERYRDVVGAPPRRPAERPPAASTTRPTTGPAAVPPEVDEMFAPTPGPICSWCDFRRHCPEGQAAGPERRPWDGLAD